LEAAQQPANHATAGLREAEPLNKYSQDNLKRDVGGAAGFFTKPLDAEAFYPTIERYCSFAVTPAGALAA
jgi:hypothetical protein